MLEDRRKWLNEMFDGLVAGEPSRSETTGGLSRRDVVGGVVSGVVGGVVSTVTNWFTPPPPQRQAVELSGGTHHRVDAGSVKWAFDVPQATVTVVRAKAPAASWV